MGPIRTNQKNRVRTITLDRPGKHNALDPQLVHALQQALEDAAAHAGGHVLVLAGGEHAFSAGADIHWMARAAASELREFQVATRKLFRTLSDHQTPTIAAVSGYAHGAGAELACICDLRVGSERASFRFPGLAYGMAVGTWHLPTVVGLAKAKELLFTTDVVGAEEALRIGLLNRLCPAERLAVEAQTLAERIAAQPVSVTARVKVLLNQTVGSPLQQAFYRELYANREMSAGGGDVRSRFRSFLDR